MENNCTYFRCASCGKELHGNDRYDRECSECRYLHSLGIYTIEQYNEWLRKNVQPNSK